MEESQDKKVSIKADLAKYEKNKVEINGKNVTKRDIGDEVAELLRPMTLEEVYEKASESLATPVADLKARFEGKNAGMQRMMLGNMIRAAIKKADAAVATEDVEA